ncbi:MAG: hypothetical protein ACOC6K_04125, partial [Thermodesulfobacteriota bacterium]
KPSTMGAREEKFLIFLALSSLFKENLLLKTKQFHASKLAEKGEKVSLGDENFPYPRLLLCLLNQFFRD